MPGIVERDAGQVVHRSVDHHPGIGHARLHPQHFGEQYAGIGRDVAARLEHQLDVPVPGHARDHLAECGRSRRHVAGLVGDAQPAAQVDMGDRMPRGAQLGDEAADSLERGLERIEAQQLAADVHRHAAQVDALQLRQPVEDRRGLIDRQAELVLRLAGGDLLVRAGIYVRIDAQGRRGGHPPGARDLGKDDAFFLQLEVELADSGIERLMQFLARLADAGEHHVMRRDAGGQRARQLAARDDVGTEALIGEQAEHREVRVGLHREGDMMPADRLQPLAEGAGSFAERLGRIDIDGGADLLGDARERNILGVQRTADHFEMRH